MRDAQRMNERRAAAQPWATLPASEKSNYTDAVAVQTTENIDRKSAARSNRPYRAACMDAFPPQRGKNMTAQGNALGSRGEFEGSPERAKQRPLILNRTQNCCAAGYKRLDHRLKAAIWRLAASTTAAVALFALVFTPTLLVAEDAVSTDVVKTNDAERTSWTSFRNGLNQLGVSHTDLPDKLELLWKKPTVYGVSGTAAIVGDRVFAPTIDGFLYCLDKQTGKEVWKIRTIDDPDPNAFAPAFKSSPTVAKDTVYIGDEDGVFYALDRKTGKPRWKFDTGGMIIGGAAVLPDKVLIGSHGGFLFALNPEDGSAIWRYEAPGPINCSPAVVGNRTFTAGCEGGDLVIVDVDTGKQVGSVALRDHVLASPAVVGNRLYVGTYAGEVVAVDWKEQEVAWRYEDPVRHQPFHASAAVTEKYVVAGGRDKQVHAVDRETGKLVWKFTTNGRVDSAPVVADGRVFVGSADGNLYELDLNTGKELSKHKLGRNITAAPAVGEGVVVIGVEDDNGAIYCFGSKSN